MKKNLFFATLAATAVLAGCSKNEVFDLPSADSLDNIEFSSVIGKQTKASETSTADLAVANSQIEMYNYKTTGTFEAASSFVQFFTNQPETLSYAVGKGWTTTTGYKWSNLGTDFLNIIAVHPALVSSNNYSAPTSTDLAKFDYTVAATPADQKDLIASSSLNLTQDNTNGKINMKFKHILSQVKFLAKTDNANFRVQIKSLKVVGAENAGTFSFSKTAPVAPATAIGSWAVTPAQTKADYDYLKDGTALYTFNNNVAQEIMGDNGVLMLMPQPAHADLKFEIVYDVLDDVSTDVITASVKKEAAMVAMAMGNKYVYTLILPNQDSDVIRFDVTVEEWDNNTVIEHERKFEVLPLNATKIETNVKGYATAMAQANKLSYIHTVQVTGVVSGTVTINLSSLAQVAKGTQIILDFTNVTGWSPATNTIAVSAPGSGWTSSASAALDSAGKVTLTKN